MKKSGFGNFILIIALLAGLSLLLYPSVSDYWNSMHQSRAIASYAEQVATLDEDRYADLWQQASAFNQVIPDRQNTFILSEAERTQYNDLLNVADNGVMGYVEIPSINCSLPIYHGTDDAVLQVAVGHLEWTSLPTGGEGTHCVISGHRGLPSAKLFTDLDRLIVGDVFMLRVLDEILTYEVDQILIVEPKETKDLRIEPGQDYCTMVTCTPYGINTHRLLVRGHRIENLEAEAAVVRVTSDALQIEPLIVAPILSIPILLILLIVLQFEGGKPKNSRR